MFNSERLKQARLSKNYTQAELASLTGVKQQMISKLETGKSSGTADSVKLAYALNVEPAWLEGMVEHSAPYAEHITLATKLNDSTVGITFEYINAHIADKFNKLPNTQQAHLFLEIYTVCHCSTLSSDPANKEKLFSAVTKSIAQQLA